MSASDREILPHEARMRGARGIERPDLTFTESAFWEGEKARFAAAYAKLPESVRTKLDARVLVTPLMARVRGERGLSRELDAALAEGDERGAVEHAARPVEGCACTTCERHRGDAIEYLAKRCSRFPAPPAREWNEAIFPAYPHFYPDL